MFLPIHWFPQNVLLTQITPDESKYYVKDLYVLTSLFKNGNEFY